MMELERLLQGMRSGERWIDGMEEDLKTLGVKEYVDESRGEV